MLKPQAIVLKDTFLLKMKTYCYFYVKGILLKKIYIIKKIFCFPFELRYSFNLNISKRIQAAGQQYIRKSTQSKTMQT